MAAEFPPNLDDGELYLPSDIFINERMPTKFDPSHHCFEDMARHFNALSLLQQTRAPPKPKPKPKPKAEPSIISVPHHLEFQLERFKAPVRNITVEPLLPPGYFGVNGGPDLGQRLHECGTGSFSSAGFDFHFLKPTPSQARTSRVLQRQQNRLLQQNQNRVLRGGFGFNGGLVRESGGTGVFHPRIINSTTASDNAKKKQQQQQSMRSRLEMQMNQQRNAMKRVGLSKREDFYYHLPPEMGLPRDWTY